MFQSVFLNKWQIFPHSYTLTFGHMLHQQLLQSGGPFQDVSRGGAVWEGVLFHLALLPCARQVVKKREGEMESEGGGRDRAEKV